MYKFSKYRNESKISNFTTYTKEDGTTINNEDKKEC